MNRCTRAALLILAAGAAAAALMLVTGRLRSASSEQALGGYSTSLEGRGAEQLFNIVRVPSGSVRHRLTRSAPLSRLCSTLKR